MCIYIYICIYHLIYVFVCIAPGIGGRDRAVLAHRVRLDVRIDELDFVLADPPHAHHKLLVADGSAPIHVHLGDDAPGGLHVHGVPEPAQDADELSRLDLVGAVPQEHMVGLDEFIVLCPGEAFAVFEQLHELLELAHVQRALALLVHLLEDLLEHVRHRLDAQVLQQVVQLLDLHRPGAWVFITGGCSGRGVQWIGVVLYSKLVHNTIQITTPCFHCTPLCGM